MDAWEILIGNSTAPDGSDVWAHLNSQSGGTGEQVILNGGFYSKIKLDESVLISKHKSQTLMLNIEESSVIIEPEENNTKLTIEEIKI